MAERVTGCNPLRMGVYVGGTPPWDATLAWNATLTLLDPHSEYGRVDAVVEHPKGRLAVIPGTPSLMPALPPLPEGARVIAWVSVPCMASAIWDGLIVLADRYFGGE
jgi:hypothetical protein